MLSPQHDSLWYHLLHAERLYSKVGIRKSNTKINNNNHQRNGRTAVDVTKQQKRHRTTLHNYKQQLTFEHPQRNNWVFYKKDADETKTANKNSQTKKQQINSSWQQFTGRVILLSSATAIGHWKPSWQHEPNKHLKSYTKQPKRQVKKWSYAILG